MNDNAHRDDGWAPPFCAHDTDLICPKCGENGVRVREHSSYWDTQDVEAYCCDCHVRLTVQAAVQDVVFHTPELTGDEVE